MKEHVNFHHEPGHVSHVRSSIVSQPSAVFIHRCYKTIWVGTGFVCIEIPADNKNSTATARKANRTQVPYLSINVAEVMHSTQLEVNGPSMPRALALAPQKPDVHPRSLGDEGSHCTRISPRSSSNRKSCCRKCNALQNEVSKLQTT